VTHACGGSKYNRLALMGLDREYSLRDVPCPVCESSRYRVLYPSTLGDDLPVFGYDFSPAHSRTYRVVACDDCSHGYCSPRALDLFAAYEDVEDASYLENRDQRLATSRLAIAKIREWFDRGRLLDIGCSTGDFLSMAREHYDVEGLELSRWAVDLARAKGLKVHDCRLSGIKESERFDIITLWGVIEHFDEPRIEVEQIRRLLKPGGCVFLWTGDIQSSTARVFGKRWWWYQGQHIQIFSERSLVRLFQDHGFEKIWIGRYPYVMVLKSVAKSMMRYPIAGRIMRGLVDTLRLQRVSVTFRLPGEMFAVFRKAHIPAQAVPR
jgi:SAM-dependent methyltransferase